MSTFDINSILTDLENGAVEAAKSVASGMVKEAAQDATDFVSKAVPAISRYITLAITKQITLDEFKSLMLGLLNLAEMNALTEAGLALVEIEKTKNAILGMVTQIAITKLPI